MGLLSGLKGAFAGVLADADKALGRINQKGTLVRVCQAAYLIAAASGGVSDDEKVTLGRVIGRKLPQFKATEVAEALGNAEEECALSQVAGKLALMSNIAEASGTEDARVIMLAVLAVANADGEFDDAERAVAREVCSTLRLQPREYQL